MNKRRLLFSVLAIAFGIFLIIFGEIDDSPGGQFLGLMAVIVGVGRVLSLSTLTTGEHSVLVILSSLI
jgi:hypothetical protein